MNTNYTYLRNLKYNIIYIIRYKTISYLACRGAGLSEGKRIFCGGIFMRYSVFFTDIVTHVLLRLAGTEASGSFGSEDLNNNVY